MQRVDLIYEAFVAKGMRLYHFQKLFGKNYRDTKLKLTDTQGRYLTVYEAQLLMHILKLGTEVFINDDHISDDEMQERLHLLGYDLPGRGKRGRKKGGKQK